MEDASKTPRNKTRDREDPATALSWLLSLFPLLHGALAAAVLLAFIWAPTFDGLVGFLFVVYLLPILCYRVLEYFFPGREGAAWLSGGGYSPWWGGQRLQALYEAVPLFEALLRIVPGAYSSWLRLWGSSIGKRVHWSATVRVSDRALLDIGHDVIVGHGVELLSHLIAPRRRGLLLVVRHVEVGPGSFLGAYSRVGPGAVLGKRVVLGAGVELPFRVRVSEGAQVPPGTRLTAWARVAPKASRSSGASAPSGEVRL